MDHMDTDDLDKGSSAQGQLQPRSAYKADSRESRAHTRNTQYTHQYEPSTWQRLASQIGAFLGAFIIAMVSGASVSWLMTESVRNDMESMSAQMAEQQPVMSAMSDAQGQITQLAAALNALQIQMLAEAGINNSDEAAQDVQALKTELATIQQDQNSLDTRLRTLRQVLIARGKTQETLVTDMAALKTQIKALEQVSSKPVSEPVMDKEDRQAVASLAEPVPPILTQNVIEPAPSLKTPEPSNEFKGEVLAALRQAVEAGLAFSKQITLMKQVLPDNANVLALERLAADPTARTPDLLIQFTQLQEAWNRRAEEQRRANWRWYKKLAAGMVRMRSPPPTGGDEEILQSAVQHLLNDDLDAARLIISRLSPEAQIVLEGWRDQVGRRLEIDRHIAALERTLSLQTH